MMIMMMMMMMMMPGVRAVAGVPHAGEGVAEVRGEVRPGLPRLHQTRGLVEAAAQVSCH